MKIDNKELKAKSQITIDGKIYLICRHFIGSRDIKDAVFTVIKNDANRMLLEHAKESSSLNVNKIGRMV